ncbi:DUF3857 domain-containing protein [Burkholderiaceae bacterium UC74_6]
MLFQCLKARAFLFFAFTAAFGAGEFAQAASLVGAVPDWVRPLQAPAPLPVTPEGEGVQYLLVDRQTRVAPGTVATYRHFVQRVQYESQLAESSEISIDFAPSYQRLILHHVQVRRANGVVDKLRPAAIQLLQRERDLEARILDGRRTAHLVLEDIRVGDIVDYDYTIEGGNPALANIRYGRCDLQFSLPVERVSCRLLWPQQRELQSLAANGAEAPKTADAGGGYRELIWERRHQPALKVEDDAPASFDPYPHVEWGDSLKWGDVVSWALPLYRLPAQLGPELERERDTLRKTAASDEERTAEALRLVQGKVRYLGIEIGEGSYAPRAPELVFHRRFGDCKDKALLLTALLRSLGIEASPALVNTSSRQALAGVMPSPVQFDHVIVKVKIGARSYWLDPTRATQYGTLDTIAQADYRQALVIDPQAHGLEAMARPEAALGKRRMQVSIDATGGAAKPASMQVRAVHAGAAADRLRADLDRQSREDLQKAYLNFYAGYYPGISVAAPLQVQDDTTRNELVTIEHYSVPELWHRPKDDKRLQAAIFSGELNEYLKTTGKPRRTAPLQLAYPMDVEVSSEMRLPRGWGGKPSDAHIAGPGFEYRSKVTWPSADKVVVTEAYKSLDDEVPALEAQDYNDKINRAKNSLGYTLYDLQAQGAGGGTGAGGVNWPVLVIGLGLLAALARGAWRLYQWDPAPSLSVYPDGPRGLGGWLLLLGFGLLVRLGMGVSELAGILPAYSIDSWNVLTTPGGEAYHALWAPVMLIELAAVLTFVIGAGLLLVLFCRRRSSFPRLMMALMWTVVVFTGVDAVLVHLLPVAQTGSTGSTGSGAEWFRALLSAAIWSSYLDRSRRVANTFVERRFAPAPAPTHSENLSSLAEEEPAT